MKQAFTCGRHHSAEAEEKAARRRGDDGAPPEAGEEHARRQKPKGGEVFLQLAFLPFIQETPDAATSVAEAAADGRAPHAPGAPRHVLPKGITSPGRATTYLSIRLLRGEGIHPPPHFGRSASHGLNVFTTLIPA